jgi:hypothetical protein
VQELPGLQDWALFRLGTVYPLLLKVDLQMEEEVGSMPLSEQQLQHLCSCCPAVQSLRLNSGTSPFALLPLRQLSALTQLAVHGVDVAAAAVADVAAQLTGLKQLELRGLRQLVEPALLPLTALTGLESLTLQDQGSCTRTLANKVGAQQWLLLSATSGLRALLPAC